MLTPNVAIASEIQKYLGMASRFWKYRFSAKKKLKYMDSIADSMDSIADSIVRHTLSSDTLATDSLMYAKTC